MGILIIFETLVIEVVILWYVTYNFNLQSAYRYLYLFFCFLNDCYLHHYEWNKNVYKYFQKPYLT